MGNRLFVISDTHFGHEKLYEESLNRPFKNAETADRVMIARWNETVSATDRVVHLGDVAMSKRGIEILGQLNGYKILVAGNHDTMWMPELMKYFKEVRGYWRINDLAISHMPLHPMALRKFKGNIHGHMHAFQVMTEENQVDNRYLCVSVEQTDYRPLLWEEVINRFRTRNPKWDDFCNN
jgi:calcineurin-like phosphoesterase family protein